MRKRWLSIPIILVLLALGITAGAVFAQEDGDDGDSTAKTSFAGRVASILGLQENTVQDALHQAASEAKADRLQNKLDRMVESGSITQEQANEYLNWIQAKPEGINPGIKSHSFGKRRFFGGGSFFRGHGAQGSQFSQQSPSGITGNNLTSSY